MDRVFFGNISVVEPKITMISFFLNKLEAVLLISSVGHVLDVQQVHRGDVVGNRV